MTVPETWRTFTQAELSALPAKPRAVRQRKDGKGFMDQATWVHLDGVASALTTGTPAVATTAAGLQVSGWVNLVAGAKADVFLRVVGSSSGATGDPAFGNIELQVR